MKRLIVVVACVVALAPSPVGAQAGCTFQLGFKAVVDQMPAIVGDCLENEHFNLANGNAEQRTTAHHGKGGLLVWRKADNWTAFTDGAITWVSGPNGLQSRPNTGPLFPWEGAGEAAPLSADAAVPSGWAVHVDPDKTFRYPAGWKPYSHRNLNHYLGPNGEKVQFQAPLGMPGSVSIQDLLGRMHTDLAGDKGCEPGPASVDTINGASAGLIQFSCRIADPRVGVRAAIKRGLWVHYVEVAAPPAFWTSSEATLRAILLSYTARRD